MHFIACERITNRNGTNGHYTLRIFSSLLVDTRFCPTSEQYANLLHIDSFTHYESSLLPNLLMAQYEVT